VESMGLVKNNVKIMANKKLMVLSLTLICMIPFVLAASKFNIKTYVGSNTCNLPKGSKINFGMPVRSNNNFEVSDFELDNSMAILLVKSDESIHKCSHNKRIGCFGKISAAITIDSYIKSDTYVALDCRLKDRHNDDHFVGVFKERIYGDPYVRPEQAWLVNYKELKFIPVNPALVECDEGSYDEPCSNGNEGQRPIKLLDSRLRGNDKKEI